MKDQREEKKVKQKGVGVFKIIWNIISRFNNNNLLNNRSSKSNK